MRMDVVNKTSSESFQVHQLSSVGHQWEISLLQPVDAIFPSQSLMAHQALSCFFMLKVCADADTVVSSFYIIVLYDLPFDLHFCITPHNNCNLVKKT